MPVFKKFPARGSVRVKVRTPRRGSFRASSMGWCHFSNVRFNSRGECPIDGEGNSPGKGYVRREYVKGEMSYTDSGRPNNIKTVLTLTRLKSLVLRTNISGISPQAFSGGGVAATRCRAAAVSLSPATTTSTEPLIGGTATIALGVGVGCSGSGLKSVPVIAVWLSMQTSATVMHMRCELMLRKPMKPSSAIANRLENQNRGTVHTLNKSTQRVLPPSPP